MIWINEHTLINPAFVRKINFNAKDNKETGVRLYYATPDCCEFFKEDSEEAKALMAFYGYERKRTMNREQKLAKRQAELFAKSGMDRSNIIAEIDSTYELKYSEVVALVDVALREVVSSKRAEKERGKTNDEQN